MSNSNNISLIQLILTCVGTAITVLVIVISAYISLKVDGATREARILALEKRLEKVDEKTNEKFDRILDKLTELEVKIGRNDGK